MKKIQNNEKLNPDFPETTEEEVNKVYQAVLNKYGIELPHEDAIKFARLYNELSWWIDLKNDPNSMTQIIEEALDGYDEIMQKNSNKKTTKEKSADDIKTILLNKVAENQKQRIGDEMTAILESNRKS